MDNCQEGSSSQNENLQKEVSELRLEVAQLREELRNRPTTGTTTPTTTQSTNVQPAVKMSRSKKRRLKMLRKREEASKMEKSQDRQEGNQSNWRGVDMGRDQGPSSHRQNSASPQKSYQDNGRDPWSGPKDGNQERHPTGPGFQGAPSTSRSESYYEFDSHGNQNYSWNDSRRYHESNPPTTGFYRGHHQDSRRNEVRDNYQDRYRYDSPLPREQDSRNNNWEDNSYQSQHQYRPETRRPESYPHYQDYHNRYPDQPSTSSGLESIGDRFDGHQTTSRISESRGRANGNQQNMMDASRRYQEPSPPRNSALNPYRHSRNDQGSRLPYQEALDSKKEAPRSFRSSMSSRWDSQENHQHYGRTQSTYQEPLDSRFYEEHKIYHGPYGGYHPEYQPSNLYHLGTSSGFDSIKIGGRFDGSQTPMSTRRHQSPPRQSNDGRFSSENSQFSNQNQPGASSSGFESIEIGGRFSGAPSRTGSTRRHQSPPRSKNDYSSKNHQTSNPDQSGTSSSGIDNFDSIEIGGRFSGAPSRTGSNRRRSPPRPLNDRTFNDSSVENELGPSRSQIEALRDVPGPSTSTQYPSSSNLQKENTGSWDSLDEIEGTRTERQNPESSNRQVVQRENQTAPQSPYTGVSHREQRAQNPPPAQRIRRFGLGFLPLDFSESSDGPSSSEQRPAPRYFAKQDWGQEPSEEPQSTSDSTSPSSDPNSPARNFFRDVIQPRQRSRQRSPRRPAPIPHGWNIPRPRPGQEQYLVEQEEEQTVVVEEPEPFTVVFDPFDERMLSSSNGEVKFFEDDEFSWVQTALDLVKGHGDGDLRARIEQMPTPSLVPGKEAIYCRYRVKEVIEVIPRPRTPDSNDDLPLVDDPFWRPVEVRQPLPQVLPPVALPEISRPETPRGETTSEEESDKDGEW